MQTEQERLPLLKTERSHTRHEIAGLLLMGFAALFFGISGLLVRYVTAYGGLAVSTVVLVRGIIQTTLAMAATAVVPDGQKVFRNTPKLWGLLALRGGLSGVALLALYKAFNLLDLSIASSIYYTNPVLVLLFSNIALHEPVRPPIALAAFLCLIGGILVTYPFRMEASTSGIGVIVALTAAVTAALAYTTLRAIATKVNFLASVLSSGVFTLLVGLATGGVTNLLKSTLNTGIAVAAASSAFCAQCWISKGYEYCTAGKGALVRNIELPLAYVFGIAFLGEVPNVVSVLGGTLVLVATLIVGYEAVENDRRRNTDRGNHSVNASAEDLQHNGNF